MSGLFPDDAPVQTTGHFARVALERGLELPDGLTYSIPHSLHELRVGDRVLVPLGKSDKPVSGYVLAIDASTVLPPARIKPIAARDPRSVNLPDDLIELAQWIARYYLCPMGMVLATMLPAAVKRGTGLVRRFHVTLHDPIDPASLESIIRHHKLRGKQKAALARAVELAGQGKLPIDARSLADDIGSATLTSIQRLVEIGLLTRVDKTEVRAAWAEVAREPGKAVTLNPDQQLALDSIFTPLPKREGQGEGETQEHSTPSPRAQTLPQPLPKREGGFTVHLLHGVTGSGKTEVYIRAIERMLAAAPEKRAIVLVPEISLTPQTVARFHARFERVAVLHSGLTAAQRHEQWTLIRQGWAQVVVGARSAVFAPLADLGLIVVDEEHDASYKQDQLPRYHARDVAIKRAQLAGAAVILGSATPSLESYYNAATRGAYTLLSLPQRATPSPLPRVEIVDLTEERRKRYQVTGGAGVHLLSLRLEHAMRRTFDDGGQAILLLNRRGFANYIACPDQRCGWIKTCDHCDVAMVYHKDARFPQGGLVRCHYCSYENLLPTNCPVCKLKATTFGLGTQRVEEEVIRKFPDIPAARMDSDAMRTARDYAQTLDAFRRGDTRLLLGTQMIGKGLDFPNVRLVGVISADTALVLPDFRSAERTFQLVCQVAGRCGRGDKPGLVIVQTFTPGHEAIELAAKHDYESFAKAELAHRKLASLPPITRMARIVVRNVNLESAQHAAVELGETLRKTESELHTGARVLGPFPAPISRIAGYYRQQLEVTAESAGALQKLLAAPRAAGLLTSDAHTAIDIDPVSLL